MKKLESEFRLKSSKHFAVSCIFRCSLKLLQLIKVAPPFSYRRKPDIIIIIKEGNSREMLSGNHN